MQFDIKKWQDKHLITESKLKKEIDFKSHGAYKKYKAKHKMRKTTKVNIGGKETTAADADKVVAKKDKIQRGAPKTNPKPLDKLAKMGMAPKNKVSAAKGLKEIPGVLSWEIEQFLKKQKDAKKLTKGSFTDLVQNLHSRGFGDIPNGANLRNWQDVVKKHVAEPKKSGDDYEATYAKAAKTYTDKKVAAVAKQYNAKPATINPRSGLSDQSIKKIQKNMAGELYKNDYEDYDKEWLNHKLNVQGPQNPGGTFERYDFMPHDFSGSESSAEGILTGLDTLMNQSSLERPYIHNTFSQMTKKQAHAGLDALKKKYSYDEDKMVKSSRDPETGEYIPANKHWRNHFETIHGKVKRYERALETFETPLEPEGIKYYADKIKKGKRPEFMYMAVAGAGKYKPSETSESIKIQEARIYKTIQELRALESNI